LHSACRRGLEILRVTLEDPRRLLLGPSGQLFVEAEDRLEEFRRSVVRVLGEDVWILSQALSTSLLS